MPRLRLQKFLAAAGVDSRRHCEALIQAGHVAVNGAVVTELGSSVDPEQDTVVLDGKPLQLRQTDTYLLLHKPEGYVTTAHDERGRPTVMDLLPNASGVRLFPVGGSTKTPRERCCSPTTVSWPIASPTRATASSGSTRRCSEERPSPTVCGGSNAVRRWRGAMPRRCGCISSSEKPRSKARRPFGCAWYWPKAGSGRSESYARLRATRCSS